MIIGRLFCGQVTRTHICVGCEEDMKFLKALGFAMATGALVLNISAELFRQYIRASCGFSSMFSVAPFREPISDTCLFWQMNQVGVFLISTSCGVMVGIFVFVILIIVGAVATRRS